ncbi:hypothetical protein BDZ89DRAFT_1110988 [Hymenopellis radicata]|nr:hypothetical protein BDZ89DRAFT_1110988 [Hymenopellis radicata]
MLYLDDDEQSLKSCLTTSKAFFPAAHTGIWRIRSLAPCFHKDKVWRQKLVGSPLLLSFIRFLDFDLANNTDWEDFAAVAGALKRITRIYLDLSINEERLLTLPVARGWRLTSMEISLGSLSLSCAILSNFPSLRDVTLRECSRDSRSASTSQSLPCKRACLPQLTALTIEGYERDAPTIAAIVAGHLFSLERLCTLELIDSVDQPHSLISTMPRTLEELIVDGIESIRTPEYWDLLSPLTFGPVPCIVFSIDTKMQARETLIWWIKTFRHNSARNSIQKVTIGVQLHLGWNEFYPPRVRFPVWKELAHVLAGLGQLRQLTIVYTALYKGRRGWPQERKKRQSITDFLKKALIPVTDTGHVHLTFIDRNL